MTASTVASRWTVPAICWTSAGRGPIAATSGRRFYPLPPCWKAPSPGRGPPRPPGPVPCAGGPFSPRGGRPIAPKPARWRATAERAGNGYGKCGRKPGAGVTIRPLKKPVFPGFPDPVSRQKVILYGPGPFGRVNRNMDNLGPSWPEVPKGGYFGNGTGI